MTRPNNTIIVHSLSEPLRKEQISRVWESPQAGPHVMTSYIPWPVRLLSLSHQLDHGSMNVQVSIDGIPVALAEGSSPTVTTSRSTMQFDGPTRIAGTGARIIVSASSLGGAEGYAWTLLYERLPIEDEEHEGT